MFCDEHVFRVPRIGLVAYVAPEIVGGVLNTCAALPEAPEDHKHVGGIMDVISAYWDSLYEPAPPQTSMPRSSFKEWSRRHP